MKLIRFKGNKIAVIDKDISITYEEIHKKIMSYSHMLKDQYHINKGDRIIVNINNSISVIIALYSILNIGATYIPVDISFPLKRLHYICKDANARFIINENGIVANHEWKPTVESDNTAYIMYTSGTTGMPKGIKISTKALETFLIGFTKSVFLSPEYRSMWISSISFDMSILDIFIPLYIGMTLTVFDNHILSIRKLADEICKNKINLIHMTPTRARVFVEMEKKREWCNHIKCILLGGEALSSDIVSALLKEVPDAKIYNCYGPTETTVYAAVCEIKNLQFNVGLPIEGYTIVCINDNKVVLDYEEEGEILICGDGVADGYLNLEKIEKEKFISIMVNNEMVKAYRTGDVGKRKNNGSIECYGRRDTQVKINGYRIELDDIANCVRNNCTIQDVAVTVFNSDDIKKELILFVVTKMEESCIRNILMVELPSYLIPNRIIKVDRIPKLISGKIDYYSLINTMKKMR